MHRKNARSVISPECQGPPGSCGGVKIAGWLKDKVDAMWNEKVPTGAKVLGVHMRGTDKQCTIGGAVIPPSSYSPLMDAYLRANTGAVVAVATDSPKFEAEVRAWFEARGAPQQLMMYQTSRSDKNLLHEDFKKAGEKYQASLGTMMDMLLLSRSSFVLGSNSALSEAAVWLNPALDDNSYNLQFGLTEQQLPHHTNEFADLGAVAAQYNVPTCAQTPPTSLADAARLLLSQHD